MLCAHHSPDEMKPSLTDGGLRGHQGPTLLGPALPGTRAPLPRPGEDLVPRSRGVRRQGRPGNTVERELSFISFGTRYQRLDSGWVPETVGNAENAEGPRRPRRGIPRAVRVPGVPWRLFTPAPE